MASASTQTDGALLSLTIGNYTVFTLPRASCTENGSEVAFCQVVKFGYYNKNDVTNVYAHAVIKDLVVYDVQIGFVLLKKK